MALLGTGINWKPQQTQKSALTLAFPKETLQMGGVGWGAVTRVLT